jgi:hypothetical protein
MDSGESFHDLCTRLGLHDTPLIDIIEEIDRLRTFIAEKDREIERLTEELDSHSWEISPAMAQQRIDKLWAENKRLERDILMLVRLCLSHGIISRGMACIWLGCAREDLDDMLRVVEDDDG